MGSGAAFPVLSSGQIAANRFANDHRGMCRLHAMNLPFRKVKGA
jgi:hypothetical protein